MGEKEKASEYLVDALETIRDIEEKENKKIEPIIPTS